MKKVIIKQKTVRGSVITCNVALQLKVMMKWLKSFAVKIIEESEIKKSL